MKKKWLITILLIIIILFPINYSSFQETEIFQEKDEVKEDLKHYRFKDLGITSAKKPLTTHLWFETTAGVLYLVDSIDPTKVYKSVDKGDNLTQVDIDPNDSSGDNKSRDYNIFEAWHDRANTIIYFVDYDNVGEVAYPWKLDYSDDTVTDLGSITIADTFPFDIFLIGADIFVFAGESAGGWSLDIYKWVDPNWVEQDNEPTANAFFGEMGVVIGTKFYFRAVDTTGNKMYMYEYDNPTTTITNLLDMGDFDNPDSWGVGMAYDGSNLIRFVVKDGADHKLMEYNISGNSATLKTDYTVSVMANRNNVGIVPNEFEKGFSVDATETVYEITARRGGIRVLQNMANITDAVIIAITDNFLMNDDGDMFEFVDVTNEISTILYNDGIVGITKRGNFTTHPDFHINWNKGDSIKIYDQYDQLEFHGLITDKNRNSRGIYVYKIDSFTNEIFHTTYEKSYSGDDLDTKQKDMIDNACDFCYRSSSVVGTTTTFNYVYNRALVYLFWLGRRLERQVPYIEPDGKIWTKAHDGLVRNDMIYPGTFNFKDEADGTSGMSIDGIDGIGTDYTATIITSYEGHKKVLSSLRAGGFGDFPFTTINQVSGTIEFYIGADGDDSLVRIYESGTLLMDIQFEPSIPRIQLFHGNGVGGNTTVNIGTGAFPHIRIDFDCATDTWSVWVDGVSVFTDQNFYSDATATIITQIGYPCSNGITGYFDAIGYSWDPAYNIGDNEVAWDINNNWQDVQFIDIPGIEEMIQGFFDGNTGITRNTVRYRDNAQTIRPVAATRDPIEQLQGILPLNEFRDPKIEESTEADQLGDNRYAIWSADTLFLGLRVLGQGYLQPGKTIHVENTGQITVAESNLLLLSFVRDPKNDVYSQMILSDNIIFPSEFTNLDNTSPQQTHTSIVQSFENQADIIAHLTPEGGLALRLTNKTGAASVKGTLVEADGAVDGAFDIADADSKECCGVIYEDGIADGDECLIVISGRCQVLLKDATASTRRNWVKTSDVAGRADATNASPAAAPTHFEEIGHCIESKGADTDVLAFIMLHFN